MVIHEESIPVGSGDGGINKVAGTKLLLDLEPCPKPGQASSALRTRGEARSRLAWLLAWWTPIRII